MIPIRSSISLAAAALVVACGDRSPRSVDEVELARFEGTEVDSTVIQSAALATARQTADELARDLGGLVMRTLQDEGPVAAVEVCSGVAQQRTAEHAAQGVYVRRVSERLRNADNAPDAAEAAELQRLAQLHAEGGLPPEVVRRVRRGGEEVLHYMRPIVLAPACVTCHGTPEQIPAEVSSLLRERYPDDEAVGYQAGDLRGAVSVRVDLSGSRE